MPETGDIVHFYDATAMCFDWYWFSGFGLCIAVVVFFGGLFMKIYYQKQTDRYSPYNVYRNIIKPFKVKYWWFECCLFSRRFLIALFTSLRFLTSMDIDVLLQGLLVIYFTVQVFCFPFKYQRLN
eukprot:480088_1